MISLVLLVRNVLKKCPKLKAMKKITLKYYKKLNINSEMFYKALSSNMNKDSGCGQVGERLVKD